LKKASETARFKIIVTDGVFSMDGNVAPMDKINELAKKYDAMVMVDECHSAGVVGETGRGVTELFNIRGEVDIITGTLGKAFGVNGGYVVTSKTIINYLRETAPMYIYSNPITCSEAAATLKVLEILDSPEGLKRLEHLGKMTKKFENGLKKLEFETIEGPHPIVPLMIRDTAKTTELVNYLTENGVLGTGLNFPVVPKGDEEIRFQINADHTETDINYVINILKKYKDNH